jgi:ferric-dicitrate binding protein FerR (iron transport regulator)/tetratricopeptide (TPR) repeat protein
MKPAHEVDSNAYAAAVKAARGEAGEDIEEIVTSVELRVAATLAQQHVAQPTGHKMRWSLGLAAALVATASVLVVLWPSPETPPDETQFSGAMRVVLRAGGIVLLPKRGDSPLAFDTVRLEEGTRMQLDAAARIDVALGDAGRMVLKGPAQASLSAARVPELIAGSAAFEIASRRGHAPFVVRAGGTDVVVHGTRFALAVEGGRLVRLAVTEGTVELRPKAGEAAPPRFVQAGEAYSAGDTQAPAVLPQGVFDEPWWAHGGENKAMGYLTIGSRPDAAQARINGFLLGQTPVLVLWPAGEHRVQLDSAGYEPWSAAVTVEGEPKSVAPKLSPIVGKPSPREDRRPAGDPWALARSLVEQHRCAALATHLDLLRAHSATDEERARARSLDAECSLRTGGRRRALEVFQSIVADFGATATAELALFESATLQDELDEPGEALATVERYVARYPSGEFAAAAAFRRCDLLLRLEHPAQARECLESFRARFSESPRAADAALLLAASAFAAERWPEAAGLYSEYLSRAPNAKRAEEALYHLIVCQKRGGLDGLGPTVEQYLARYPNGAYADWVREVRP